MKKITREDGQDIRNPLLATPIKPINEIVIPAAFYKVDNLVFHAFLFALRLGRSKPQPVYARANPSFSRFVQHSILTLRLSTYPACSCDSGFGSAGLPMVCIRELPS
jgi:hypothetical protein